MDALVAEHLPTVLVGLVSRYIPTSFTSVGPVTTRASLPGEQSTIGLGFGEMSVQAGQCVGSIIKIQSVVVSAQSRGGIAWLRYHMNGKQFAQTPLIGTNRNLVATLELIVRDTDAMGSLHTNERVHSHHASENVVYDRMVHNTFDVTIKYEFGCVDDMITCACSTLNVFAPPTTC